MGTDNTILPYKALHPGEVLREELREYAIKQKDFAAQMGVSASHLNEFIKGKRTLSEDWALLLGKHTGIPYETWMRLHADYIRDVRDIAARDEATRQAAEYENICNKVVNLPCILKRLHLDLLPIRERTRRLQALLPADLRHAGNLYANIVGLYKHSERVAMDERNMYTWLVLNNITLSHISLDTPYRHGNAISAAHTIATMANKRTLCEKTIKECLNAYGIIYAVVKKIEKAPIDAFSTFRDAHPCITVTYRYDDLDKLAFDILHELCHIDKHLSTTGAAFIAMESEGYHRDSREEEANAFARDTLIPADKWKNIISVQSDNLSPQTIVRLIAHRATQHGISPSLAVARYKHDTGWYKTATYKSPKITTAARRRDL